MVLTDTHLNATMLNTALIALISSVKHTGSDLSILDFEANPQEEAS